MSMELQLVSFGLMGIFITMILHVAFGQITVRKLRKNPKTKDVLGSEFVSGWDIFNVAGAQSRPKWLTKKFKQSTLSFLTADAEILYKHTTPFDRILAKIFWWMSAFFTTFMVVLAILSYFGFWDN